MSPVRLGLIAAAIGALALFSGTAAAQSTARCDIGNANGETYQGPCIFTLGPKGSFSVVRYGNGAIIEDMIEVRVTVIAPGIAEVHGLTGLNTDIRWGRAKRATTNKACWRGTSFWICVYGVSARPAPASGSPPSRPETTRPSPR